MRESGPDVQLQPPGAGLPFLEWCVARAMFAVATPLLTREMASTWFRREAERIGKLARSVEPAVAAVPVLIPRVTGIEDSSRSWSVLMTLAHLVSVNEWITEIVERLTAGQPGGRAVSIADVKPSPDQDAGILDRFVASSAEYPKRIERIPRLRCRMRHAHPWFGELDGHGWHCLAALHMAVHHRQIEQILKKLPPPD